ncbi:MAG: hypothetical protein AAGG44_04430 [Planctomycetota bacterium]
MTTGSFPVTSKRSLTGDDAKTYGKLFIAIPIIVVALSVSLVWLDRLWLQNEVCRQVAFYVFAVGLPASLALVLDRARKRARRAMFEKPKGNGRASR